jgi:hypothetical protein
MLMKNPLDDSPYSFRDALEEIADVDGIISISNGIASFPDGTCLDLQLILDNNVQG